MQFTHLKCTIQWHLVYAELCIRLQINLRTFSLPQKEALYPSAVSPSTLTHIVHFPPALGIVYSGHFI